jgi:hypothetical protein
MVQRKRVTLLRFDGPRFQDHGLVVDVLPEITAYRALLQQTAKELWRRKHPNRVRLPKNFNNDLSLKFFRLEPGSTAVPLMRDWRSGELPFDDELDEAAALLQEAVHAADQRQGAPTRLPRSIILLFDDLGRTLRDNECLFISSGRQTAQARYDRLAKRHILAWASSPYPDDVDLVGEVRATDLDGLRFTLRLPDGQKVIGRFRSDHEAIILEALGDHLSRRIHIKGTGQFAPEDGKLKQIINVEWLEVVGSDLASDTATPIWERLALISAKAPEPSWNDVPTDLAKKVDQYLHRKDHH